MSNPETQHLRELSVYLEANSDRLTKALDNLNWTPRRSHAEGDRNAFLSAANTLQQIAARATVAAAPAPAELSFDQVLAAFDAITQEGKRQHVIVWGAMVSIQDIYNFIRVAHRAALAAPQAQEGHACRPQYKMRELPDPDCKACTTVSRPNQRQD